MRLTKGVEAAPGDEVEPTDRVLWVSEQSFARSRRYVPELDGGCSRWSRRRSKASSTSPMQWESVSFKSARCLPSPATAFWWLSADGRSPVRGRVAQGSRYLT